MHVRSLHRCQKDYFCHRCRYRHGLCCCRTNLYLTYGRVMSLIQGYIRVPAAQDPWKTMIAPHVVSGCRGSPLGIVGTLYSTYRGHTTIHALRYRINHPRVQGNKFKSKITWQGLKSEMGSSSHILCFTRLLLSVVLSSGEVQPRRC